MKYGIVSRSFSEYTNEEAAKLIKNHGFSVVELYLSCTDYNIWKYNSRNDDIDYKKVKEIADIYRHHDLDVVGLGCFTNLIDDDETQRKLNFEWMVKHIEAASYADIKTVSTECGFNSRRGIDAEKYETQYQLLVSEYRELCKIAQKHNIDIALETCVLDIVPSAKRTRDFIKEVNMSNAKVLLDTANLIANSTEEEMLTHLANYTNIIHAKDRKINDAYGCAFGDGEVDYYSFFRKYKSLNLDLPVIFEYINNENCTEIFNRLKKIIYELSE